MVYIDLLKVPIDLSMSIGSLVLIIRRNVKKYLILVCLIIQFIWNLGKNYRGKITENNYSVIYLKKTVVMLWIDDRTNLIESKRIITKYVYYLHY